MGNILRLYRDDGKDHGNYYSLLYIAMIENKMETTI